MTLILKQNEIKKAVNILKKGGIIVYPTETSYGLGCDWINKKACRKIYKIKGRMKVKKLSIIVSDLKMAKKYLKINKEHEKLIKKFMPGPLTLISLDNVAFRISSNKTARNISLMLKKPIVSTSANISGNEDNYRIKNVIKIFSSKVDAIIDGGNLKKRKPSTVFDVKNKIVVRRGPVKEKDIHKFLLA